MSAHALVEMEVRPAEGCTLYHATDTDWDVYCNDGTACCALTVDDVAWALENPVEAAAGGRGYGTLWVLTAITGLKFLVVEG